MWKKSDQQDGEGRKNRRKQAGRKPFQSFSRVVLITFVGVSCIEPLTTQPPLYLSVVKTKKPRDQTGAVTRVTVFKGWIE